jgi:uncharacterized protein (DUF1684 family)
MTTQTFDAQTFDLRTFQTDWLAWREQNEARRRAADGFLAYRSVQLLSAVPTRVESVPGVWSTGDDGPVVELAEGESLVVDGREVTGRHAFGAVAEREFRRAASVGDVILELSKRGGIDLLRPIDPAHALRAAYVETPAYAPDPAWILSGEYMPFAAARDTVIDAAIEGITHRHDAVGEFVFQLGGLEHRLLFLSGGARGGAFAVFTDATSGVTTYRASRSLAVATLPAEGGPTRVDFNRTANLQCAYTDHSPCPLAPAQNRLPVVIEAGEQIPVFRDREPRRDSSA